MDEQKPATVTFIPELIGERFFEVPKLGSAVEDTTMSVHTIQTETRREVKEAQDMRYAAYIRISSDEQVGNFSVDAQRRAIDTWVKAQGGKVVSYYVDEAQSGRTADRPQFISLRRDAKKRKFDAIVVHKFDRFARNRTESLAIKSLLRHDYGIKVYSVTEPSEDSDGAIGALIEGIMESVADWYSRNLAQETVKGKRERAMQGYHNNLPPYGLDKGDGGVLVNNSGELVGLNYAFELYSTGEYSDNRVAVVLNEEGYRTKSGRPFSTDMVREMLQNRTYLGYVKYQPYKQHADGRRSWAGEVEWFKGKHQAVISEELFNLCQDIRQRKSSNHEFYPKHRVYLLRNLVYCADCVAAMPQDCQDREYGKMRPHSNDQYLLYRCRARDFGRACPQGSVHASTVDEQVVEVLRTLKPPADWRKRMISAMGELLGDQKLEERIAEIKAVIERMDFRWDNGFIDNRDDYLERRVALQRELEQLTPIPDDELVLAADVLEDFEGHWAAVADDPQRQHELIKLIVARVWVRGDRVVAMSLRPNFHVTVGLESKKPTEVSVSLKARNIVRKRGRRGSNPRSLP